MKKFKFRLQPVLKFRQQQEEQKKRVVGSILSQMNKFQNEALEMDKAIQQQRRELKKYIHQTVDLKWISHYHGYVTNMQRSIGIKINEVKKLQNNLTEARRDLAEAARQTRIIEKLKEKMKNRYLHNLHHREIVQQDEISTNNFLRTNRFSTPDQR